MLLVPAVEDRRTHAGAPRSEPPQAPSPPRYRCATLLVDHRNGIGVGQGRVGTQARYERAVLHRCAKLEACRARLGDDDELVLVLRCVENRASRWSARA